MNSFLETFKCGKIKIVDVGAMAVASSSPEYDALIKAGVADVIGFEPGEAECRKLNNSSEQGCSYLPYFIGDGSERTFYRCNHNMTSSLYEPNTELLEKFQNIEELTQVIETSQVQTKRLDDLDEAQGVDYLKIDVQGAELDVFKGSDKILDDVLVVHTEVEFVPLYKNQPLFGDVDQHLRSKGFSLHRFDPALCGSHPSVCGRAFKPLVYCNDLNTAMSQQLWADVIYIKDFMGYESMPVDKLKKLAVIMHEVYESYDLVHYILQCCDKQTGDVLASEYLTEIAK